jgi:predicted DNA binding CopG/RHH family protein
MNEGIKPVNDPKEVPTGLSDEEQIEFWESHGVSEEFLAKTEQVPEEERPRPRPRTKPVSVRLDDHTIERLKTLADMRGIGYQTLLKEFVTERLYEEEKREGIVPVGKKETFDDLLNNLSRTMPTDFRDVAHLLSVLNDWNYTVTDPLSHVEEEGELTKRLLESSARPISKSLIWHMKDINLTTIYPSKFPLLGSLIQKGEETSALDEQGNI